MKAKIFCLSLALENPHQALDAYNRKGSWHEEKRSQLSGMGSIWTIWQQNLE